MNHDNQQFYVIDNFWLDKPQYAYISDVRFPDGSCISKICPICKRSIIKPTKEIMVDIDGGKLFPDYIHCNWDIVVSERVIESWQKAGVTGYQYYDVLVDKILSKKLQKEMQPKYYHIVVSGFCDWDKETTDMEVVRKCILCGGMKTRDKWETGNAHFAFNRSTWDNTDIFYSKNFTEKFCTNKIVKWAIENKHSGVRFYPADDILRGDKRFLKHLEDLGKDFSVR